MPDDDPSGARPPVVLRIKLRYDDVAAMVHRFAPNVGKSGLFIPTRSLQPIGTEVKFELRLSNDQPVLVGLGRVKASKAPDPANPRAAFGMAIELMRVTREAREVIMQMLERRRAMGLADVAIPMPEDVESARRADVETQPRADTGAIVASAMVVPDSAPILVARPSQKPPEALLTAPRPSSGQAMAPRSSTRPSAPALAPEPARAKRQRFAEVMATAGDRSGALAAIAVPGLDDDVDIERAMMRARALAGASDLDAELAALREPVATPFVDISIEAASAALARALGGAAVSKRAGAVAVVPALGAVEASIVAPALAEPEGELAAEQLVIESGPVELEPAQRARTEPALIVDDEPDQDLESFSNALDAARVVTGVATPVLALREDSIDELDPDDLEELPGESTQIGQVSGVLDSQLGTAAVARQDQVDVAVDRQLVAAEADDTELAASIRAAAAAYEAELAAVPEVHADFEEEEISDLDVLAEADASDADLLTSNGERESAEAAPAYAPPAEYPPHEHPAVSEPGYPAHDPSAYARADPAPAELADPVADPAATDLTDPAHLTDRADRARALFGADVDPVTRIGDDDGTASSPATRSTPLVRPVATPVVRTPTRAVIKRRAATPEPVRGKPVNDDFDFASHLDLGDDDDGHPAAPSLTDSDAYSGAGDYTFAEGLTYIPPVFVEPPGLDAALDFDDPHQFETQTPEPRERRGRAPSRARATLAGTRRYRADEPPDAGPDVGPDVGPDAGIDFDEPHRFAEPAPASLDELESALSTLDVDLDHLEVPQATRSPRARRSSTGVTSLPGMPPERAPVTDRPNRTPKRRGQAGQPGQRATAAPAKKAARPPRAPTLDDGGVLIDFDDDDDES